jgi:hypothetical protein
VGPRAGLDAGVGRIVEISIAVKFFTKTGLLALCSDLQPGGVPILLAFYDMHGLQWYYSFPRSPHGEYFKVTLKYFPLVSLLKSIEDDTTLCVWNTVRHIYSIHFTFHQLYTRKYN